MNIIIYCDQNDIPFIEQIYGLIIRNIEQHKTHTRKRILTAFVENAKFKLFVGEFIDLFKQCFVTRRRDEVIINLLK